MGEPLVMRQQMLPEGIVYIEAEGFLDHHTYGQIDDLLTSTIDRKQPRIILKLEKIDYISSAGAGALIGARSRAQEQGGDIVLLNASPHVLEVFGLLGFSQLFQFAETREQAVSCFAGEERR